MEGIKTIIDSRELIGSTETVLYSTERIISPLEAKAIHGSIDSTETIIGSTETVLSPLEAKTVMGGISQGEKFSIDREKWWIGNHDSAPRMYGATFSPIAIGGHVYNSEERTLGKGLTGNIYQGEKHIITSESKGLLRNPEQ
ncbi:hypothetical protein HYU08_01830 [Candidatus Woesearchaeota archaeon]|nr:hypothetical protein [Candidatus Woesearchaeota archaeon]